MLVIQQADGHWCFPKGHVKKGETEHDTAYREIKEETGLDVKFERQFRSVINYAITHKCEKEVVYFIAYEIGGKERMQKDEVSHMYWCKPMIALGCLTYENDAELLKEVIKYRNLKW